MHCVDCGKSVDFQAKFCSGCGKSISNSLKVVSETNSEMNPETTHVPQNITKKQNSVNANLLLAVGILLLVFVGRLAVVPGIWDNCGSVAFTSFNIFQQADLLNGKFEGVACTGLDLTYSKAFYDGFNFWIISAENAGYLMGFLLICIGWCFYRYRKIVGN